MSQQLLRNYERREEMTTRMLLTDLSKTEMRTDFSVTTLTVHHCKRVTNCTCCSSQHTHNLVFQHCTAAITATPEFEYFSEKLGMFFLGPTASLAAISHVLPYEVNTCL